MRTGARHAHLTTSAVAADAYEAGVDAVLRLRSGAVQHFSRALALDPTFGLAHAALALLGHEFGAPVDVPSRLASMKQHASRCSDAERSHLVAVDRHLHGDRSALPQHLRVHPEDALLLTVAVPTIAFAGVTEVPTEAWQIVESCAPAYGDDWFYAGLLAFVRQEQGRWEESMDLACAALAQAPDSGHAAHARAHVHYETGDHAAGLAWLDRWILSDGAHTESLSHYSWHAAMHELSAGDLDAVARRYAGQLAAPHVQGCRSVVDTGSLVWRWSLTPGVAAVPPIEEAVAAPGHTLLVPETPFVGLHSAMVLCAADDGAGLGRLHAHAEQHHHRVMRAVVAPLARALQALVSGRPSQCADELALILPQVWRVGGSDAQREVVEETRLTALLRAGRYDEARAVIEHRLDRRPCCRRDTWFRDAATPGSTT